MRKVLQNNAAPLSTPSSVRTRERTAGFSPYSKQGESMEHIQNAMRELREQYSELIAATWFIDDSERGLIASKVEPDPLN
jgi:hypothetical protein